MLRVGVQLREDRDEAGRRHREELRALGDSASLGFGLFTEPERLAETVQTQEKRLLCADTVLGTLTCILSWYPSSNSTSLVNPTLEMWRRVRRFNTNTTSEATWPASGEQERVTAAPASDNFFSVIVCYCC